MTLKDFIITRCKDILDKRKTLCLNDTNDEDSIFSYDNLLQDDYGNLEKVIYDEKGIPIKINDIIELPLEDFTRVYNSSSSLKAYRKYLEAYKIIYGVELLTLYYRKIEESVKQLNEYDASLNVSDLKDGLGLSW